MSRGMRDRLRLSVVELLVVLAVLAIPIAIVVANLAGFTGVARRSAAEVELEIVQSAMDRMMWSVKAISVGAVLEDEAMRIGPDSVVLVWHSVRDEDTGWEICRYDYVSLGVPTRTIGSYSWDESGQVLQKVYVSVAPPREVVLQTTEDAHISERTVVGQLDLEYPTRMTPESSDLVTASICIPVEFASVSPLRVTRIKIPRDAPLLIGELDSYQAPIQVAETMRVELSSPSFEVESVHPSVQKVNIHGVNEATFWAWMIKAPSVLGRHVLTIRVYLNEELSPVWAGSLEIEVVASASFIPTPTVTPTPTPLPTIRQIQEQLISNTTTIVVACIALVGTLAGAYVTIQNSKRETSIKQLEKQLELKEGKEEIETLKEEIARLRSRKWWQPCRK
jgi:hypothetical protein